MAVVEVDYAVHMELVAVGMEIEVEAAVAFVLEVRIGSVVEVAQMAAVGVALLLVIEDIFLV
jgi:hypothetical protein